MTEAETRETLTLLARSLFERGYAVGSAGNISAAVEDGILITPTNSCLGFLDPAKIAKIDRMGRHLSGDKPSKEVFLHQAFYDTRPGKGAVVHLHSTYATVLSCLEDVDPDDAIPPLTPYVVMRVGRVKLLPYARPGDLKLGDMIRALGGLHGAVLLANHGPVVAAGDLKAAIYACEELEETAKVAVMLRGLHARRLTDHQVTDLMRIFAAPK